MSAHHSDVAGVIHDALLLFEGAFMCFVDDDQAEIRIGQKERRPRTDRYPGFAGGDSAPSAPPFRLPETRVPSDRFATEARRKTRQKGTS